MDETISWEDLPQFMAEARDMARRLLAREQNAQSIQTTALVMTALRRQRLISIDQEWHEVKWDNRHHFFAALHRAMIQALKDHARRRTAQKRTVRAMLNLDDVPPRDLWRATVERPEIIVALFEALEVLKRKYPELAVIVQHRYFDDFTIKQTAQVMELSERTVQRYWQRARVLLRDEILERINGETTESCDP
ncbi:MAG: hypothetical protein ETSY1_38730 [Candidatus Entotheonella factor]|uniref:RNA polymerase sigma-70 ECF-like HTH domain-containing protein n=1 Tax=Entotheonella factor TaxID=1429438 RepID=W4L661_ENTF1|nr:MAG: hypothetical protein ETSY1_38730 [Candidatus Entotheonella factor]